MKNNIGDILWESRNKRGITQAKLCYGICSAVEVTRIEKNQKTPDFFLLDRLFERLGRSTERLQYVLSAKVYQIYELQYRIQESLCYQDYRQAELLLKEYQTSKQAKGSIHRQFILAMRAQIGWAKGEDAAKILELLHQAIAETMPELEIQSEKAALSTEELRLWLFRWEVAFQTEEKRSIWEVIKILAYMEQHEFVAEELTKVYPYGALLLYKYGKGMIPEKQQQEWLKKALEMLREEGRILYLPEILSAYADVIRQQEPQTSQELYRMRDALLSLEEEYNIHLEKYRLFCCINRNFALDYEMIRHNRLACNMTMEELCEGICSWEEISRIERGKCKPNDITLELLLGKLERKKGRVGTYIITDNYEILNLQREFVKAADRKEERDKKKILEELEKKLDMDEVVNKQFIESEKIRVRVRRGETAYKEGIEELFAIVGMTLPMENKEEMFSYRLSTTEVNILNQIAIWYDEDEQKEKAAHIWREIMRGYARSACNVAFVTREWDLISENLGSLLSVMDDAMEEAVEICRRSILGTLLIGKVNAIPRNLTTIACIREEKGIECLPQFYQALRTAKLMHNRYRYQCLADYLKEEGFQGFCEEDV